MSRIQLVNDGLLESTSVSNLFIDYYMIQMKYMKLTQTKKLFYQNCFIYHY